MPPRRCSRFLVGDDDAISMGREPVAGPPPLDELQHLIGELERRAFTTYKCRIHAHQRLSRLNNAWNTSLIAFSTSTTIASVGMLVDRQMYGRAGEVLMVALAILSLVASLVVSSISYGSRARAMESNYKGVQQISLAAETLKHCRGEGVWAQYHDLQKEYSNAVNFSENHTSGDHRRMILAANHSRIPFRYNATMVAPFLTLLLPVALLAPFVASILR